MPPGPNERAQFDANEIHLWRPGSEPDDWQLDATTREDDYDTAAVSACRERLLKLLPRIAQTWEEKTSAE